MESLIWVVLIFLAVVSIIDLKFRKVPSIFLTGMLFVVAFISILLNPQALTLGVLGFIISYMLFESDYFSGIADIKIFTLCSFMVVSFYWLLVFIIILLFFGIVWKSIIRIRLHKEKNEDFAFLPVFFFVFLTLVILGGIK